MLSLSSADSWLIVPSDTARYSIIQSSKSPQFLIGVCVCEGGGGVPWVLAGVDTVMVTMCGGTVAGV